MRRPGRPRLEIEIPSDVLRRYEAGEINLREVAKLCDVSVDTGLRELRRLGIDTSRRRRKQLHSARRLGIDNVHQMVVDLYGQGLSLKQVAEKIGLTHEGIRQILVSNGIPRRPRGAARTTSDLTGTESSRGLRALRIAAGLTQHDLAERTGLSKTTIYHIEHQRRGPTKSTIARLARGFGLTVEEFMARFPLAARRGAARKR